MFPGKQPVGDRAELKFKSVKLQHKSVNHYTVKHKDETFRSEGE